MSFPHGALLAWLILHGPAIHAGDAQDIYRDDGSINTAAVRRIEAELAQHERPKLVREAAYSELAGRTKRKLTVWDQPILGATDPFLLSKGVSARMMTVVRGKHVLALANTEEGDSGKGHLCWVAYSRRGGNSSADWLWDPQDKAVYIVLVHRSVSSIEGSSVELHRVDPNHVILPLPMDFVKIPEDKWPEEPKPIARYAKVISSSPLGDSLINRIRVKLEERRLVVDTYYNDDLQSVVFTFDLKTHQWSAKGSDNVRFEDVQPPE